MKSILLKTLLPASIPGRKDKNWSLNLTGRLSAVADLATANVVVLEGLIGPKNVRLKILFAGNKVQKHFIARHFFNGLCTESYENKITLFQMLVLLRKTRTHCDLAIIEGDFYHRYVYQRQCDFFVPLWLKSYAEIPLKALNRSAKEDLRRARNNNLTYTMTRDHRFFDEFYHGMYLPYVQMRHQESTIPMDYEEMMRKVQLGTCQLLLVLKGNEAIAGLVILRESSIPRLWSIGLKNGDQAHWKEGAIAAAYNFASQYMAQQGFTQMHLGLMRSFYRDGVFQNKKKWGITIATDSSAGFIIKPLGESGGLNHFQAANLCKQNSSPQRSRKKARCLLISKKPVTCF
jgi:hypothetical protein